MDHTRYVAALARAVDVLRRSLDPGEPQVAALKALVELSAEGSINVRFYDGVLTADGAIIATADPRLASFPDRLAAQSIAEIVIARGAEAPELLALATGLGAPPGQGRIKEKLRDAGSSKVMVVTVQPNDMARVPTTISGAFAKVKSDEATLSEWNRFLDHGAATKDHQVDVGLKDRGTGEIQVDIHSAEPARTVAPRAEAPPPPLRAEAPPAAPPPPPLHQPPTLQASSPLGVALARLLGDPFGADTLAKLTQVSRQIQDAFARGGVAEAIDACNTLIELEKKAPEPARTTYGVLLRRTLTGAALARVAPYLLEPRRRDRADVLLRRAGEESISLLVGLLAEAQSVGERLIYLEVLRGIATGVDRVLTLLSRNEWQIVRNVAELAGEARLEEAVGYVARLIDHQDDRVRRAAIVALAKIGSASSVEPLRQVIRDGTPELRALIATSVTGPHARPLTGPLATLADEDENPDVIRACYKALGRIGTAEAKHALKRAASHKSLFSRRAKVAREAAEEVLKTLGSQAT